MHNVHQLLFIFICFFFNDTATTEIYTLSLHDALPILPCILCKSVWWSVLCTTVMLARPSSVRASLSNHRIWRRASRLRSEEHTSELQSRQYLVCRLLLEKKKKKITSMTLYQFKILILI